MITYERLSKIIPADQALACKAMSVSLQQVKNIDTLSLPQLAAAFVNTVTTKDLDQINALTTAVPPAVAQFYTDYYATGTGTGNTLVLTDLLGAAVGVTYIDQLNNVVTTINSLGNGLSNLTTIYVRMQNTVNGVYGNAVSGPVVIPAGYGNGTYTNADVAFSTALIPNAVIEIGNVVTAYPTQTTALNTEFNTMAQKIISETDNLTLATINIAELNTDDRSPVMSFVESLPEYGVNKEQNGPTYFLEQVADLATLGGQAIVACLREGQNLAILNNVGIGVDTSIPSEPSLPSPVANLIPATYTESQAANLVVI
ncbi:MAG: hypothetical protein EBU08_07585 [Micrococcales bacterium]|nr:hypothetical protein [Micrococcales bacterium]